MPGPDEVKPPLRGRPLRDRFVLRLIAVEKVLHVLVIGLLAVGVLLFASHKRSLKGDYTRILNDFQAGLGGPAAEHHGLLADLDKLFSLSTTTLYLIAAGLAAYAALLMAEVIGLWWSRRWAEYFAFIETIVFVPYEIYELTSTVSVLKILALVVNVAILLYLSLVHRLFGIRGGPREVHEAAGWPAIRAATPVRGGQPEPA